jgi:hypothetical protein
MRRYSAPFAALVMLASGCSSPTLTMTDLGQPVFTDVVGADARYERVDPKQTGGLDAYPATADADADHRMSLTFWPGSTPEKVGIEVKAKARGKLPLKRIAAAVYPVSHGEAQRFARKGTLPDPTATPLGFSAESEPDETGWRVLAVVFPRESIPPGTAFLAVPVLSEFKDGWVHLSYYKTMIPEPMKFLSPEEVEQLEAERAQGDGQAAGSPSASTTDASAPTKAEDPAEGSAGEDPSR